MSQPQRSTFKGSMWLLVACAAVLAGVVTWAKGSSKGAPELIGDAARSSGDPAARARLPGEPTLVPTNCWVQLPGRRTSCGWVTVPLAPGSRVTVRLPVVRVLATRRDSRLPPLLYLGGGPGHSVIRRLLRDLEPLLSLSEERDLVFFDPRGTGFAQPTLECREEGALEDSLRRCHERQSVEVDPSEFTTMAGVRDVDDVRRALGIERWDVLATSYGARWALTLLRERPQSVRAAVLDSPVPLEVDLIAQLGANAQRALDRVASACAEQPTCAASHPEVGKDLLRVAADLARAPLPVEGTLIDVDRFVRGVLGLLYAPSTAEYLPQLIHRAARGDFELFLELEAGLAVGEFFLGVHLSAQCAEEVPFTTREAVLRGDAKVAPELRRILSGGSYLEDCGLWQVEPAPALENAAVRAEHPVLILSGELDPVTPPFYADLVQRNLPAARLLRVRGGSHGLGTSPCGLRWVDAFLRAPEAALPLRCPEVPSPSPAHLAPGGTAQADMPLRFRAEPPGPGELARLRAAH